MIVTGHYPTTGKLWFVLNVRHKVSELHTHIY